MWQIFQGVRHLHRHNIGCRDISLENILVQDLGKMTVKVMDFGQAVLCRTRDERPFRYFGPVGKPYYRPPEAVIPLDVRSQWPVSQICVPRPRGQVGDVAQVDYEEGSPEILIPAGIEGEPCDSEVAGYRVEPFDMFSCGVLAFILCWKVPPWKFAKRSDRSFMFMMHRGIRALITGWRKPFLPEPGMECISGLLHINPRMRLSVEQALESEWISAVAPTRPAQVATPQNGGGGGGAGYPHGDARSMPLLPGNARVRPFAVGDGAAASGSGVASSSSGGVVAGSCGPANRNAPCDGATTGSRSASPTLAMPVRPELPQRDKTAPEYRKHPP